jgi:hypothetical protein
VAAGRAEVGANSACSAPSAWPSDTSGGSRRRAPLWPSWRPPSGRGHPRLSRAQVHLGLGETDAVFDWLDRAVDERDPGILDLPCKPIWDPVREDPRFTALLRKMRLV